MIRINFCSALAYAVISEHILEIKTDLRSVFSRYAVLCFFGGCNLNFLFIFARFKQIIYGVSQNFRLCVREIRNIIHFSRIREQISFFMAGVVAYASLTGFRSFAHCYGISKFSVRWYIFRADFIPFRHRLNRITPRVLPDAVSHNAVCRGSFDCFRCFDCFG